MVIKESVIKNALRRTIKEFIEEDRVEHNDGSVEIDNFKIVYDQLSFGNDNDTLYFVQIVKRDKDNPGQKSQFYAAQYLKEYYFKSLDEFKSKENEIKQLCQSLNARAYIYMNPRSERIVNKWTQINLKRMEKHREMKYKFQGNAKALAAGRSFDDITRPICFIDVDSNDENDIKQVMDIIKKANIKPLFTYRSLNNGIHIVLPNKEDAKKLDFTSINGDLSKYSKRVQMNAKVGVEIDKPCILYAKLIPQGYQQQQNRFNKWTNNND